MPTKAAKKNNMQRQHMNKVNLWIQANKHGKTLVKRDLLKQFKAMESDGYTIRDVIEELERQLQ